MTPVRKHEGAIQVPVDTYINNQGRNVVLYGMMHIGAPSFYDQAFDALAIYKAQGWEVHYEKIDKNGEEVPAIGLDMIKVADAMGLVYQMKAMPYPANWKRTDMTVSEFLSHSSKEDVDALVARMKRINGAVSFLSKSGLGRSVIRGFFRFGFGLLTNPDIISAMESLPDKASDPMRNSVVIGKRNEIALRHIDATNKDVVAVWGSGHLKGIGEGLVARGFVRIGREWNTVLPAKGK